MAPPLGWIAPQNRNQAQSDAHAKALTTFPKFVIPQAVPSGPVKVMLTDFWKDKDVVFDVGYEFTGFRQLTGSCVGVSAGNAIFTLSAIQRKLETNPTVAFVPWWPLNYGRTRYREGDRGQGEGAIDSVMAQELIQGGVINCTENGLPQFDKSDGLALTSGQEMAYSDGGSSLNTTWAAAAKLHPLGAAAVLNNTTDMKTAILNGYPVLDGCNNYIGNGSIQGDCVVGNYDGAGGHSTCYLGYWDHPTLGPLFLYSNQWDGSTYPKDPAGAGRCCVWVKEANAARLFSTGGDGGETVALSHLSWFPAQPQIMNWSY